MALFGTGGCYQQVIDAVVDPSDPDPGGTLMISMGGAAPLMAPALAKGSPMTITTQSPTLVASLTCGDDSTGRAATDVLGAAGGTITLTITPTGRSQLQVHAGGMSCVATDGMIQLAADADLNLSGSFSATGQLTGGGGACALSGTLSMIPQAR